MKLWTFEITQNFSGLGSIKEYSPIITIYVTCLVFDNNLLARSSLIETGKGGIRLMIPGISFMLQQERKSLAIV